MRQRLTEKSIQRLRKETGLDIKSASIRGNTYLLYCNKLLYYYQRGEAISQSGYERKIETQEFVHSGNIYTFANNSTIHPEDKIGEPQPNKPKRTTFVVVSITNNIEEYPESREDTKKYPHLIEEVEDEQEEFIINKDDPEEYYKAGEFFYSYEIKEFIVTKT